MCDDSQLISEVNVGVELNKPKQTDSQLAETAEVEGDEGVEEVSLGACSEEDVVVEEE
jgi:hypothetical protein